MSQRAGRMVRIPVLSLLGLGLLGVGGGSIHGQQLLLPGPITTVSGDVIETESLMGQVVLINAWATWCGPCVREMPGFQRVLDEFEDQGFSVLGVSADTVGVEVVRAFAENLGISLPYMYEGFGPIVKWQGQQLRIYGHGHFLTRFNGVVYISPVLIIHYTLDHGYKPPDVFIEAVRHGKFLALSDLVWIKDEIN